MKCIRLLAMLLSVLCAAPGLAADRLRIAYSSISAAYAGIWVARDAGFFAKEGLEDQIIFIPSATQLAQVLVAGDVDIASLGGGPVMAASLSGADLKVVGNNVNKLIFSIHTKPEVKTLEELRGKRIAVSRFGSSADAVTSLGLNFLRTTDPILGVGGGLLLRGGPVVADVGYRYKQVVGNDSLASFLAVGQNLRTHQVRFGIGVRF